MRSFVAATLFAVMLLAGGSAARAQISVGIVIGQPPPPRVIAVVPRRPGPEFIWIGGYWYPVGRRYVWHDGYWTRPPYEGARWEAPRYEDDRYFVGYWDGPRGRVDHDHHWDHEGDRDHEYEHDRGRHRGHGHGHDHEHDHDR